MAEEIRRNNYYFGKLLTAEDLAVEQEYHRRMRYLHNRILGWGIAEGLDVSVKPGPTIVVSPGIAIDRQGREIVLPAKVRLDVADSLAAATSAIVVTATWAEEPNSPSTPTEPDAPFEFWVERPHIALDLPAGVGPDALELAVIPVKRGHLGKPNLTRRRLLRSPHDVVR
jgi:hypothetical protein